MNSKDMSIEALRARVQELETAVANAGRNVNSLRVEDLGLIKKKYAFYVTQYPGANYTLNDDQKTNITFVARSNITTDTKTGMVVNRSTVGEFWTDVQAIKDELDAITFGVRRMSDEEILACIKAQG